MKPEKISISAETVKGIASGLFMMAVFTIIWVGIAFGGLHTSPYAIALIIFVIAAVVFITKGISIYKLAKHFPGVESEKDKAEEKRTGKWFGIIFGLEGLFIFIAINVVVNLGHAELTIPAIALVVGLHFYPLAKVFKRTIDYYLATWSTLVAITAVLLSLNNILTQAGTMIFTGVGLATATSFYGLYMMNKGKKLRAPVKS